MIWSFTQKHELVLKKVVCELCLPLHNFMSISLSIVYYRHSPVHSCVQDPVIANGQQGVEAISYTGERYTDEAVR